MGISGSTIRDSKVLVRMSGVTSEDYQSLPNEDLRVFQCISIRYCTTSKDVRVCN